MVDHQENVVGTSWVPNNKNDKTVDRKSVPSISNEARYKQHGGGKATEIESVITKGKKY